MSISVKGYSVGILGISIISGSILNSTKPDSLFLRSVNNTNSNLSSPFQRSTAATHSPHQQFIIALH
ncbi:hypothetical protein HK099_002450, partial [Clydaea vesicula]